MLVSVVLPFEKSLQETGILGFKTVIFVFQALDALLCNAQARRSFRRDKASFLLFFLVPERGFDLRVRVKGLTGRPNTNQGCRRVAQSFPTQLSFPGIDQAD